MTISYACVSGECKFRLQKLFPTHTEHSRTHTQRAELLNSLRNCVRKTTGEVESYEKKTKAVKATLLVDDAGTDLSGLLQGFHSLFTLRILRRNSGVIREALT